jgi:hypothetical protein
MKRAQELAPRSRGRLASSISRADGPLFSQAWQVPIMLDPTIYAQGGIIQVPANIDATEVKRVVSRKANGQPTIIEVGVTAEEAADRLAAVFGGHWHRDQEVDLISTGEVVAWFCLDCDRVRYADSW